jgi:hypothetical protein
VTAAIMLTIQALSPLLRLIADDAFTSIRDDAKALAAKLTATLPAKPDGSAWTDDDVHAAAAAAQQGWLQALATLGQTR